MNTDDDDVTQGPDDPNAAGTDTAGEDGMDLDLTEDTDDEEPDEDKAPAGTQTVAQLTAQLAEAKNREKAANARAAQAARRAVANKKALTSAGVGKNGKPKVSPTDPEDRSGWPEAARKAVEALEAQAAANTEAREKAEAASVQKAIHDGLIKAGLRIPKDADPDARRRILKRAMRVMDTESIELDQDGDVIGVEDEIENVRAMLPDLFSGGAADTDEEDGDTAAQKPKPKINPGGGRKAPAVTPAPKYKSTAEFLVSPEYANRNSQRATNTANTTAR